MEDAKIAPELMQSLGPWVQSALLSHQGLVRPAGLPPRQMAQLTRITFEGDQGIAAAAAALQGIRCAGLRQTFDIVAVKPNCASSLVKVSTLIPLDMLPWKRVKIPFSSLCLFAACFACPYADIAQLYTPTQFRLGF